MIHRIRLQTLWSAALLPGMLMASYAMNCHAQGSTPLAQRDIAYGEHERQRFDLFPAPDASKAHPVPVVLYFHGGGFRKGDKTNLSDGFIAAMNEAGISVASANYRFFTTDPLPAAMHDGARVVQFLRHNAEEYGIDPERIGVTGSSAGAGISLWIAFHDDLADPESDDPVARESSRVSAAWAKDVQVSYDPAFWRELGLDRIVDARSLAELVGAPGEPIEGEVRKAIDEASPITHLSPDDPGVRCDFKAALEITDETSMSELLHHPAHGVALLEACRQIGVACELHYGGGPQPIESGKDYLIRMLGNSR